MSPFRGQAWLRQRAGFVTILVATVPSSLAVSDEASEGDLPLHCCFAPLGKPLTLACSSSPDDVIADVPFAVVVRGSSVPPWHIKHSGTPGHHWPVCGSDEVSLGTEVVVDIAEDLRLSCIGHAQCDPDLIVQVPNLEESYEVLLRWTCIRDKSRMTTPAPVIPLPALPIKVEAATIVDDNGERFPFHGVNWAGMQVNNVVSGLDRTPIRDIARLIHKLGFNMVRLPFSVESVLENPFVSDFLVSANPEFKGKRAMQILDGVVEELGRAGVIVWLDCHMTKSDWCCSPHDCSGFWFDADYTMDQWVKALSTVAGHFSQTPAVVGIGLKNELRIVCGGYRNRNFPGSFCNVTTLTPEAVSTDCVETLWSEGPENLQWKRAVEIAGRAIFEVNPHVLVAVGGLNYATDHSGLRHAALDLPIRRVVYEAHEYSWFRWGGVVGDALSLSFAAGDSNVREDFWAKERCLELGSECAGVVCSADGWHCTVRAPQPGTITGTPVASRMTHVKRYGNNMSGYEESLDERWGFIVQEGIGPVWVSEFGFSHDEAMEGSMWMDKFRNYLSSRGIDNWAVWELSGEQVGGTGRHAGMTESFGVLGHCFTGPASKKHLQAIRQFITPAKSLPEKFTKLFDGERIVNTMSGEKITRIASEDGSGSISVGTASVIVPRALSGLTEVPEADISPGDVLV